MATATRLLGMTPAWGGNNLRGALHGRFQLTALSASRAGRGPTTRSGRETRR